MKKQILYFVTFVFSMMLYTHTLFGENTPTKGLKHHATKIEQLQNGFTIYYNVKDNEVVNSNEVHYAPQYVVKQTKPTKQDAIYCKVHCKGGNDVSCWFCSCAEARRLCGGD